MSYIDGRPQDVGIATIDELAERAAILLKLETNEPMGMAKRLKEHGLAESQGPTAANSSKVHLQQVFSSIPRRFAARWIALDKI